MEVPSSEGLARMEDSLLFLFVFSCGPVFKVFIELDTVLLLFYVLVFWPWGMWHLSSPTRVSSSALEGKVLITRPQGKSPEDPLLSSLTWLLAGGDTERKRDKEIEMKRESTRLKL